MELGSSHLFTEFHKIVCTPVTRTYPRWQVSTCDNNLIQVVLQPKNAVILPTNCKKVYYFHSFESHSIILNFQNHCSNIILWNYYHIITYL